MCHVRKTREVLTDFWWGDLMERDHLEDIEVDGSKFLKMEWGAIDWSDLSEGRDRWRTLVNAVMNL